MISRTLASGVALALATGLLSTLTALVPVAPAAAASCAANADAPVVADPSWGQQRMGAERAWPRSTGEVTVAVIDTGVSAKTPSLRGAVLAGSDLSGGRGDVDCFGRGTFIASLIAARQVDGTEFAGVAPGATILPIRVTDDPAEFERQGDPGRLAAAIDASVRAGARVIALSLTVTEDDSRLRRAVQAAVDEDVLVVAPAAGPSGKAAFPARMDDVLAVAPLTPSGPVESGQIGAPPDLAAPSMDLTAAVPDGPGHIGGSDPSLAVAYVAAAAALVMDEQPQLSAGQVGQRLIDTADAAATASGAESERDPSMGYGVVNPVAALTRLSATAAPLPPPEPATLALPPTPDARPGNLAIAVALGILVLAVAVIGPTVGVVLVRRRRAAEE
ncbi:S8 family serine peptidase [Microbacterium sp. NPDC058342]|uniref:S8 family serine peptidase n=1 Tax=Microbacterium sp. NPDC058342 TaxID=3346454 RepID=UPI00364C6DE4